MERESVGQFPVKLFVWILPIIGLLLIGNAIQHSVNEFSMALLIRMAEIGVLGLIISPWSVILPSGALWRPGMPLMMVSMFVVPPDLTVLVPIPALLVITWRSKAKWWKYFQTIGHVGAGLCVGGLVYHDTLVHLHVPGAVLIAMIGALCVHLVINRCVSAAIVSRRTGRTYIAETLLVVRELHWGYLNSYLIVLLAMISQVYVDISIWIAAILQIGTMLAVDKYSKVQALQRSLGMDGLTQTENRSAWEQFVQNNKHNVTKGTLLVIDCDDFKQINDSLGHLVGDKILVELTRVLRAQLPKDTRIFRYGGDEFVCYTQEYIATDLHTLINYGLSEVVKEFGYPGLNTSVSIGVAHAPQDSSNFVQLFKVADSQMFQQKRQDKLLSMGIEIGIPQTILAFVVAIESHDIYTAGHSVRVAFYALKLAEHMGVASDERQSLFRGALVHDVGKIGIPDSVLNKRGKLTASERQIIERHPELGYEMCVKLGFTKEELLLIRHHHERWDGVGYPIGLKGDEIPFLARILSVADVFDALTSDRSYRPAWEEERAMRFIEERAGTMFDPACAKAWIAINTDSSIVDECSDWINSRSLKNLVPNLRLQA